MSTFNKILIAALVVQVALAIVIQTSSRSANVIQRPQPLLPGFVPGDVTRLTIYDAYSATAGDGSGADASGPGEPAISLRRVDAAGDGDSAASDGDSADSDGDSWVVASHWDFPAKTDPVSELIGKLAGLQTTGATVHSKVRHPQLEVAEDSFRRKIEIETKDGEVTTLLIGKPSRARTVFIRFAGEDGVHAVSGISQSSINPNIQSWVSSDYFAVNANDVASMTVKNRHGSFEFVRDTELGGWRLFQDGAPYPIPLDKKLNVVAVKNWLQSASRLIASQPADPERSLAQPLATITLRMKPSTGADDSSADDSSADEAGVDDSSADEAGVDEAGANADNPAAPSADSDSATGADSGAPAAGAVAAGEEYVIEVGAESALENSFYVRIRDNPQAVIVAMSRIRPVVDMNPNIIIIDAE